MYEIFSDSTRRNDPKNQAELTAHLQSVESCINNDENLQQVNIEFCRRAFRLLADCGLITEDTARFLSDAEACRTYDPNLKFPYNSGEGVLRKVKHSDDIHDAKGVQRFYGEIQCACFAVAGNILSRTIGLLTAAGLPANKREFYNWLAVHTLNVLDNSKSS